MSILHVVEKEGFRVLELGIEIERVKMKNKI